MQSDERLFNLNTILVRFESFMEEGRSYRWIARDLGISKNTVMNIVKRARDAA